MAVTALSGQRWQGQTYNSASFDGTDDKAVVSNAIFNGVTGNFTVAFWFKADTNGDAMMGSYDTVTPNWQIYFSGNEIKISDGSVHVIPEMDFTAGTWYHMAWVRTSGSLQCFINGVVEDIELSTNLGSFASSQTWTQTLDGNNDTFTFGNRGNSGSDTQYFDGQLSEAIFLTEALSQADITTLQTKTAIVVTTMANANLQGYYPFTSNFNDSSDQGRNATANGATITTGSGQPDDKTTVTDVPVGSEFEQTDDYKSYQRAGASTIWSQTTNNDGLTVQYGTSDQTSKLGQKFESGHANVGKTFNKVTVKLKRYNGASATHLIYCKVYDASGSARATATTTYEMKDLTTTSTDTIFTFATPITIAVNETVGFVSNGGAYDVEGFNFRANSTSVEANTYLNDYRNGGWQTTFSSWDMYMILDKPASWVERGTAL